MFDKILNLLFIAIVLILVYFTIDYLLKKFSVGEKIAFTLFVFLSFISFAYYKPDQVQQLYTEYSIPIPAAIDTPTVFGIILLLWALFVIIQYGIIILKKTSDIIVGDGMDSPESCISSDLDNQTVAGQAFIKVGGTKTIPIRGGSVWINPTTHIHKFYTHLIFSGKMEPNTSLTNVPLDLKIHIRQRRHSDMFELKDCSVGYFTTKDLSRNIQFKKSDYTEYLTDDEKNDTKTQYINTNTFLTELRIENRKYDGELQTNEHEHDSMDAHLKAQNDTGEIYESRNKKGFFEQLGF